jgi:putative membrane protein (TIGR04086 family)
MEKSIDIKKDVLDVIKAVLVSLLFSLIAVLVLALILRWANLGTDVVTPAKYVIKFLSLIVVTLLGFKNAQNGIIKGAISGLLYMVLSFLIFAALDGFKSADFSWIDFGCLTLAGAGVGIIVVNIKSKVRR